MINTHVHTLSSSVLLRQAVSFLNVIEISCSGFAPREHAHEERFLDPVSYLQEVCSCSCSTSSLSSSESLQRAGVILARMRGCCDSLCILYVCVFVICMGVFVRRWVFPFLARVSSKCVWVYADRVQSPLCAVDPTRSARSVWSVSLEGPCRSGAWGKRQTYDWQRHTQKTCCNLMYTDLTIAYAWMPNKGKSILFICVTNQSMVTRFIYSVNF